MLRDVIAVKRSFDTLLLAFTAVAAVRLIVG